jgi:hypothetical protein
MDGENPSSFLELKSVVGEATALLLVVLFADDSLSPHSFYGPSFTRQPTMQHDDDGYQIRRMA